MESDVLSRNAGAEGAVRGAGAGRRRSGETAADPAAAGARQPDVVEADPVVRYRSVRSFTEHLCEPLETEDYVVQTVESVSPTKWHLAHVSWFFETFLLRPHLAGYEPFDPAYAYLFNSYYVQAGERHCRDRRGYISRPTVAEVFAYRAHVDEHMARLLSASPTEELLALLDVGLNHEQQHQELMLMDIKHVFSVNPLRPAYRAPLPVQGRGAAPLGWVGVEEGVYGIGHDGAGFAYDNEGPRHRVFLEPFEIANRLVTNGEYLEFMADGGYARPELWLSEGWSAVQEREWTEPFYWEPRDGGWICFTLAGTREVDPAEPVVHLSYFEADAFARWAGARLPTEQEWEVAATGEPVTGNFVETGRLHPAPLESAPGEGRLGQLYGDVWQWTRSQYSPYPGYRPDPGALGEYNGKFMANQFVLRGAACVTSASHARRTYRNFFHADETWMFSGVRLARDVG